MLYFKLLRLLLPSAPSADSNGDGRVSVDELRTTLAELSGSRAPWAAAEGAGAAESHGSSAAPAAAAAATAAEVAQGQALPPPGGGAAAAPNHPGVESSAEREGRRGSGTGAGGPWEAGMAWTAGSQAPGVDAATAVDVDVAGLVRMVAGSSTDGAQELTLPEFVELLKKVRGREGGGAHASGGGQGAGPSACRTPVA